jgi:YbgC/YbaW family acyl-CoA thioester hydrolase
MPSPETPPLGHTKFETELQVRPDDLDMFQHVHSSRYIDYVLAARFEQMERCYGMGMPEFLRRGFGWVIHKAHLEYKRPLGLGERFVVRTFVDAVEGSHVTVQFVIEKLPARKLVCDGWFVYTMVSLATARAEPIPEDIVAKYVI